MKHNVKYGTLKYVEGIDAFAYETTDNFQAFLNLEDLIVEHARANGMPHIENDDYALERALRNLGMIR